MHPQHLHHLHLSHPLHHHDLCSQDKMRFYKGTDQYVVAVAAREAEGSGTYLTLSVIPQRLGDLWLQTPDS